MNLVEAWQQSYGEYSTYYDIMTGGAAANGGHDGISGYGSQYDLYFDQNRLPTTHHGSNSSSSSSTNSAPEFLTELNWSITGDKLFSYSDDGHREENDLLENPTLDYGFFDPNNNNCNENRRRLNFLKKRLQRQLTNKASGFANKGVQNQVSAHTHAIRIARLKAKIAEYERAVANCPPEKDYP